MAAIFDWYDIRATLERNIDRLEAMCTEFSEDTSAETWAALEAEHMALCDDMRRLHCGEHRLALGVTND